ncbi:MAG TPA: uroporphyrinogen decarboxylase family protein [Planctomycetota bacterium]|nr:uroporphyrinogen decarboxylase family protein [Planctomycetota bacterium]
MTELERFRACMEYQPVDRAPFWDWGAWPETIERWKAEGLDPNRHPAAVCDQRQWVGHWFFPNPPFERKVVSEDARHVVYVNHEGILMMERRDQPHSSMPQFLKFPVETREDFRRFWAERMQPDPAARIGADWREKLQAMRARPVPFIIISDRWGGFFGPLRNLVGVERLCTLFYDDPAFVEEMMDADADFIVALMGQILDVVTPDAFGLWEDMAYNRAPLISPAMVRRHMLPRYRRVADFVRSKGVRYVGLDSDGQVDSLIPVWLDAGLNFLYPFEVQAGMAVCEVRWKYGRELRLWGGIDKRALARGPAAIDAELRRVSPLIADGGYIPHTDHSCPPDIPFANYCYYLEALANACGRA